MIDNFPFASCRGEKSTAATSRAGSFSVLCTAHTVHSTFRSALLHGEPTRPPGAPSSSHRTAPHLPSPSRRSPPRSAGEGREGRPAVDALRKSPLSALPHGDRRNGRPPPARRGQPGKLLARTGTRCPSRRRPSPAKAPLMRGPIGQVSAHMEMWRLLKFAGDGSNFTGRLGRISGAVLAPEAVENAPYVFQDAPQEFKLQAVKTPMRGELIEKRTRKTPELQCD